MSNWSLGRFYVIWYTKGASYEKVSIINFKADEFGLGRFAIECAGRGNFEGIPRAIGIGALDLEPNKLQDMLLLSSGEGPFVEKEDEE